MNIQESSGGKKRIVIVGAGFAGLHTYMELHRKLHGRKDVFITLINKTDYFLFTPMIHEVAVGNLLPNGITQSLRVLPQCCLSDFIEAEVSSVDLDEREVHYMQSHRIDSNDDNFQNGTIKYDYLVLAPGARSNYFGVEGAKEHSLILQDLNDAKRIKNHILHRFEEAQATSDEIRRKELLTFVIIGGGATGVELAGELANIFNKELKDIYKELYPLSSIKLIHSGEKLVSQSEPWFAEKTKKILLSSGKIDLILNSFVTKIERSCVWVGDQSIKAETIIWAGGVLASDISIKSEKPLVRNEKDKRVLTNMFLQLSDYLNVFVLGDFAWVPQKENKNIPYPTRAQFATQEGRTTGRNIWRLILGDDKLEEFKWNDNGFIVSLGKGGALAHVFGLRFSGFVAWAIYRIAYLSKLFGIRAKIRTALEWTLNLFLPRDLSEL